MLSTTNKVQVNKHWVARLLWRPSVRTKWSLTHRRAGSCSWWVLPGRVLGNSLEKWVEKSEEGKPRWPTFLQLPPQSSPSLSLLYTVGGGEWPSTVLCWELSHSPPPPTALWHPNPTVSFYPPRQVFLQGIHPHSYTKHFSQVQAGEMEEGPWNAPSQLYPIFSQGL